MKFQFWSYLSHFKSDFGCVRSKVGLAMICLIQSYPRHFKSDFDYVKSQNLCPWKNFFIFKVKKQHPLNIKTLGPFGRDKVRYKYPRLLWYLKDTNMIPVLTLKRYFLDTKNGLKKILMLHV